MFGSMLESGSLCERMVFLRYLSWPLRRFIMPLLRSPCRWMYRTYDVWCIGTLCHSHLQNFRSHRIRAIPGLSLPLMMHSGMQTYPIFLGRYDAGPIREKYQMPPQSSACHCAMQAGLEYCAGTGTQIGTARLLHRCACPSTCLIGCLCCRHAPYYF